jgi:hypothetical protein
MSWGREERRKEGGRERGKEGRFEVVRVRKAKSGRGGEWGSKAWSMERKRRSEAWGRFCCLEGGLFAVFGQHRLEERGRRV